MPSDLGEKNFSTSNGASLKLPSAEAILGKNATNETDSVDMQVCVMTIFSVSDSIMKVWIMELHHADIFIFL